jgi:maltose alpha-D-glucosyltransferase/alpha-amylase
VAAQLSDRDSLLTWMQRLINVRRECPECGDGTLSLIDGEGLPPEVLGHRIDGADGSGSAILFLHNLSDAAAVVDLSRTSAADAAGAPQELFSDGRGKALTEPLGEIDLPPYGYRWIRLLR